MNVHRLGARRSRVSHTNAIALTHNRRELGGAKNNMVTQTDCFWIADVRWALYEPRTYGALALAAHARIRSATFTCHACYTRWVATEGEHLGQFQPMIDALWVTCPGCGQEESVALRAVK